MIWKFLIPFLFATLLTPSLCWGELQWDKTEATIQATTSDTQVVAVYEFLNTGPNTVKITFIFLHSPSRPCRQPLKAEPPGNRLF